MIADALAPATLVAMSNVTVLHLRRAVLELRLGGMTLARMLQVNDIVSVLYHVETLRGLTGTECRALAADSHLVRVPRGAFVIEEGDRSDLRCFFVKAGEVAIVKSNPGAGKGAGGKTKREAGYHGLGGQTREAVVDAQRSDASMGRFGRLNQGEAKADRGGRRRKRAGVAPNDSSERDMTMAVMNKLLGKSHGAAGRVHTRNDSGKSRGGGGGMPGKLKKRGKKAAASRGKAKRQKR